MQRWEFGGLGGLGGQVVSTTSAHVPASGHRFVCIVAHTEVNVASTGSRNGTAGVITGLGSSSQSVLVPAGGILWGEHTSVRLTTGGTAVAYYGD